MDSELDKTIYFETQEDQQFSNYIVTETRQGVCQSFEALNNAANNSGKPVQVVQPLIINPVLATTDTAMSTFHPATSNATQQQQQQQSLPPFSSITGSIACGNRSGQVVTTPNFVTCSSNSYVTQQQCANPSSLFQQNVNIMNINFASTSNSCTSNPSQPTMARNTVYMHQGQTTQQQTIMDQQQQQHHQQQQSQQYQVVPQTQFNALNSISTGASMDGQQQQQQQQQQQVPAYICAPSTQLVPVVSVPPSRPPQPSTFTFYQLPDGSLVMSKAPPQMISQPPQQQQQQAVVLQMAAFPTNADGSDGTTTLMQQPIHQGHTFLVSNSIQGQQQVVVPDANNRNNIIFSGQCNQNIVNATQPQQQQASGNGAVGPTQIVMRMPQNVQGNQISNFISSSTMTSNHHQIHQTQQQQQMMAASQRIQQQTITYQTNPGNNNNNGQVTRQLAPLAPRPMPRRMVTPTRGSRGSGNNSGRMGRGRAPRPMQQQSMPQQSLPPPPRPMVMNSYAGHPQQQQQQQQIIYQVATPMNMADPMLGHSNTVMAQHHQQQQQVTQLGAVTPMAMNHSDNDANLNNMNYSRPQQPNQTISFPVNQPTQQQQQQQQHVMSQMGRRVNQPCDIGIPYNQSYQPVVNNTEIMSSSSSAISASATISFSTNHSHQLIVTKLRQSGLLEPPQIREEILQVNVQLQSRNFSLLLSRNQKGTLERLLLSLSVNEQMDLLQTFVQEQAQIYTVSSTVQSLPVVGAPMLTHEDNNRTLSGVVPSNNLPNDNNDINNRARPVNNSQQQQMVQGHPPDLTHLSNTNRNLVFNNELQPPPGSTAMIPALQRLVQVDQVRYLIANVRQCYPDKKSNSISGYSNNLSGSGGSAVSSDQLHTVTGSGKIEEKLLAFHVLEDGDREGDFQKAEETIQKYSDNVQVKAKSLIRYVQSVLWREQNACCDGSLALLSSAVETEMMDHQQFKAEFTQQLQQQQQQTTPSVYTTTTAYAVAAAAPPSSTIITDYAASLPVPLPTVLQHNTSTFPVATAVVGVNLQSPQKSINVSTDWFSHHSNTDGNHSGFAPIIDLTALESPSPVKQARLSTENPESITCTNNISGPS